MKATVARFGRLDALVNNAGILRMVDFERGTEEDLDALWTVNVKAPFRLIRAALPPLRATGAGRIATSHRPMPSAIAPASRWATR